MDKRGDQAIVCFKLFMPQLVFPQATCGALAHLSLETGQVPEYLSARLTI